MRRIVPLLLLALPLGLLANPQLVEAESEQNRADIRRVADPAASGGVFVHAPKDYAPVFRAYVPAKGDSFTIWVRHRGHAVQLKTFEPDGITQIEHAWAWHKGSEWKWSKLGTFSRITLGSEILLIRGPGATADAGLDAVIFSTDPAFVPPAAP
jgi:hypothetical protein